MGEIWKQNNFLVQLRRYQGSFVSFGGFSKLLRALDRDIMIIINDIAKVVHDEVYKTSSHVQSIPHRPNQRPSNLRQRGSALRRIPYGGTSSRTNTTTKTTQRRSSSSSSSSQEVQLESLPGIQDFTDRALMGLLKSFAGIHRDSSLQEWKNDFRLSAGVSAFEYTVDMIYGMDAGWAVEGAVGSEYKIDATYLSPHVNMASRLMGAAKQYEVTILVSKAVEKLLSKNCRNKLRHIDTVYVKGSS